MRICQAVLLIPMGLASIVGIVAHIMDEWDISDWCILVAFVLFLVAIGEAAYHS